MCRQASRCWYWVSSTPQTRGSCCICSFVACLILAIIIVQHNGLTLVIPQVHLQNGGQVLLFSSENHSRQCLTPEKLPAARAPDHLRAALTPTLQGWVTGRIGEVYLQSSCCSAKSQLSLMAALWGGINSKPDLLISLNGESPNNQPQQHQKTKS